MALQLPKFQEPEIDFLSEYSKVMRPLANALDAFQRVEKCLFCMALPKLVQLRHNLTQMMNSNLTYCEPLAQAIVNGLLLLLLDLVMPDAKYAAVAAICNPKYKMRWVPPNNRESLRTLFVQCAQCFCESALSPEELGQGSDDDDYGFNETSTEIVNASITETQVSAYLTDADRSLSMLDKYTVVKSTFIYYNYYSIIGTSRDTFQLGGG